MTRNKFIPDLPDVDQYGLLQIPTRGNDSESSEKINFLAGNHANIALRFGLKRSIFVYVKSEN